MEDIMNPCAYTSPREVAAAAIDSSSSSSSSSLSEVSSSGGTTLLDETNNNNDNSNKSNNDSSNSSSNTSPQEPQRPEAERAAAPSPWAKHPLADGKTEWGAVSPARALEMTRASAIARHMGDREALGLPGEKPPIPMQEWLREESEISEVRLRRGRAIEEVKRLHSGLQRMKDSTALIAVIAATRGKEIPQQIALLRNNLHLAIAPNPRLPPKAVDPEMAQIFAELVEAFAAQLKENIELTVRLGAMSVCRPRTRISHPHGYVPPYPPLQFGQKSGYPPEEPSTSGSDGATGNGTATTPMLVNVAATDVSPAPIAEVQDGAIPDAEKRGDVSPNSDDLPSGTESSDAGTTGSEPGAPELANAFPIKRYLLGPVHGRLGLFVVSRPSTTQRKPLQPGLLDTKLETGISGLDLGPAGKGRKRTRSVAKVIRQHVAELLKQREVSDDRSREVSQTDSSQLGREAELRATLKSIENGDDVDSEHESRVVTRKAYGTSHSRPLHQMKETEVENILLSREVSLLRKERNSKIKNAEAAEKNEQQLEKEHAAPPYDADGLDTAQIRHLRARDREIADLTMVRNNLRAEVIRRGGRVVGAHGEVTRERYDPVRWQEAGRRALEGLPQIYRDAWGPESNENVAREDWPLEYQPGFPAQEITNDRDIPSKHVLVDKIQKLLKLLDSERGEEEHVSENTDELEAALASLQLEISIAYQGVRLVFPEIKEGSNECLAGLLRIIRDRREELTDEFEWLQAENEALASSVKSLENRLQEESRIRDGGVRYHSGDVHGSLENRRPRHQRSAAPSPSDTEDGECGHTEFNGRIWGNLRQGASSRHTTPGGPARSSGGCSPCSGMDGDAEDPDKQGITGQGANQEPTGQELAGSEMQPRIELHSGKILEDQRKIDLFGSQSQCMVAPGDIRTLASTSRSPAQEQISISEQPRPTPNVAGKRPIVEVSKGFGPSALESPSAVHPGHGRRDSTPTIEQEARVAAQPGASARPSTRRANPGVPTRAGTRATRNPAPEYCAPVQRKRKAARAGEGEPPRKRR